MNKEVIGMMENVVGSINDKMQIFSLTFGDFISSVSLLQTLSTKLQGDALKIEVDVNKEMNKLFEMQEVFKYVRDISTGYLQDIKKAEVK